MSYAVENALYQWREGERRIANARRSPPRPTSTRRPTSSWRRCAAGSARASWWTSSPTSTRRDTDWALELARRNAAGTDAASVVDAAFARYVREAKDFAGGSPREKHEKPE